MKAQRSSSSFANCTFHCTSQQLDVLASLKWVKTLYPIARLDHILLAAVIFILAVIFAISTSTQS